MVCPHCQSPAETGHAYCTHCGMALPAAEPSAPRIIPPKAFAATRPGRTLQLHELFILARRGSGVLTVYSVLQMIGAIAFLLGAWNYQATRLPTEPEAPVTAIGIAALSVAILFMCLALWARRNPFPASIAGVVILGTFGLMGVVQVVSTLHAAGNAAPSEDPTAQIAGFVCGSLLVLLYVSVFIVALAKAISAGARHRTLLRLQAGETISPPLGTAA